MRIELVSCDFCSQPAKPEDQHHLDGYAVDVCARCESKVRFVEVLARVDRLRKNIGRPQPGGLPQDGD